MKRLKVDTSIKLMSEHLILKRFWEEYSRKVGFTDNRRRENIVIKHAFMVVARKLTGCSLSEIGKILNKDHATVVHANKNHEGNMKFLPSYSIVYKEIDYNLKKMLDYKELENELVQMDDVLELRERIMSVTKRLRIKTMELNNVYRTMENSSVLKQLEHLKKYNTDLLLENQRLHQKLNRLHNLI
jgi:hypothetical protein